MSFFKANSFADLLKHIVIILVVVFMLLGFFFFVYLPSTTNHGETISVPKITGMTLPEIEDYLDDMDLRYYVSDSSYNQGIKPFVILTQDPAPGAKVKENRKIYISVNMKNPPIIKMPKLVDGSLKNAQMILKSYDLLVGEITYVPDLAQNAVLKQLVKGKEIKPGDPVAKGSTVDLVVGDGEGNTEFDVPNVVGMPVDEASVLLVGQGLQIGSINYVQEAGKPRDMVVRQRPVAGEGAKIKVGQLVDIWVNGSEPVENIE
jgi:beta-lactam-binding protein with PASTA domain